MAENNPKIVFLKSNEEYEKVGSQFWKRHLDIIMTSKMINGFKDLFFC